MKKHDAERRLISVYECAKKEELCLLGYVKASDEWMLQVE